MTMSAAEKKPFQQNIVDQKLETRTLRYTFASKQGKTMGSLTSKQVILVFCPQTNELFYLAKTHKIPIQSQNNLKKTSGKDTAEASKVKMKNPNNTNKLLFVYFVKDEKGKQSERQWQFQMVNKQIANKWYLMLKQYQEDKAKNTAQNNTIKNTNPYSNPNPTPYSNPTPVYNNAQSARKSQQPRNNMNNSIKRTNSNVVIEQNPTQLLLNDSKFILQDPLSKDEPNLNNNQYQPPQQSRNPSLINSRSQYPGNNMNNSGMINNSKLNQSRIIQAHQVQPIISPQQSKVRPSNQSSLNNDWNYRFIKNPTRETVLQFEKAAYKSYTKVMKQSKQCKQEIFRAQMDGFTIQVADNFTSQSKRLKNQYRNYHYIIECCKKDFILNVPLACLIEHLGSVCLVKAKFPKQATRIKNKRDLEGFLQSLQTKTKISNNIFYSNKCVLLDLTKQYGSYGEASRIYVDDLYQYTPQLCFKKDYNDFQNNFYIRPQLMQYFQNRLLPGGNIQEQKNAKVKNQISVALDSEIQDVAECLSAQEVYIINIFDLKQFLHYRGLNMKFLYRIYSETRNKFVKKYLLTCIVAKIIKDEINLQLITISKNQKNAPFQQFVEEQIRYFLQGKTATTNEYWKRISLRFRDIYGAPFNTHELIGGFLLSCLMTLITAKYNIKHLDKQKSIFRDQGIINRGFLQSLQPKIKSYYRFSNKVVQTVQICKYSEEDEAVFNKLVQYLNLKSKSIPQQYNVNKSRQYILGYLSQFVPPQGMQRQTLPCSKQIYSLVNNQPPNAPNLKITLNYLKQNLAFIKTQRKKEGNDNFQATIRDSINIINYWLQFQHPKICQFYEKIANYQQVCGDTQESLKILEKVMEIANKTQAKNNKKVGMRHYVAGCQYLKAGRKKEAIDNLQKSKAIMQKSPGQQHQYALVLLKLSSLHLNNGDTDTCIKQGKQALKNAQKGKMIDTHTIKICQILCRAYQIKGQKQELRKLSVMCAKDFNKTQNKIVFNQMVKICLTGTMARLNIQRSKSLFNLACKIKDDYGLKDQNASTSQLMQRAKTSIVMDNFMVKSDTVEKYYNQYLGKKNQITPDTSQYIVILNLVTGCVGIDFIDGLNTQKQFE